MSVSNLFRRMGLRWAPDSDSVNAPPDVLLRADNLVPDQIGGLAVRKGSQKLVSNLNPTGDQVVHSLHTVELANGTQYRVAGVDDRIFLNGADIGYAFNGSGGIAIGDDSYQIFFARGTSKWKWDGDAINPWGVTKPYAAPTITAESAISTTVASFATGESPAVSASEGTISANQTGADGTTANAASLITPAAATSRATVTKLWTSDQDFFNVLDFPGTETDLFDMFVKFADPYRVKSVKIIFGCDNNSTDPFVTDRYEFEFDINKGTSVEIKDPKSESYGTYEEAVAKILESIDPRFLGSLQTPQQVQNSINAVGNKKGPKSNPRPDANVWGHLSVTRGQFKRIGSTPGRDWQTVRGFKIVYEVQKGYTSTMTVEDAIIVGGGDQSLTGTFQCVVCAVRLLDNYIEISPPSDPSNKIFLNHQGLKVNIPATVISNQDAQVNEYWVYLFGGFLDTYYRFAVATAQPRGGQTLDELTNPDGSNFDDVAERSRLTIHGLTQPAGVTQDLSLNIVINKSELTALTENERLPPYQSGPPDNMVAVAGPWRGRMFCMDEDGYVHVSSNRSPSNFNSLFTQDLTRYGDPLWLVKTGNGVYAGMEKDIIFFAGSGNEDVTQTQIDLYAQPLNIGTPPIDKCAYAEGNSVIYRSADGLMILSGSGVQPLPTNGTSLLWRGLERHGVSPLNVDTGRFRCVVDNRMLYMLAPEGLDVVGDVIYRYSFDTQQWSRLYYPQAGNFYSLAKEPLGVLVAGDDEGNVWQLDFSEQDDQYDIPIYILTPIADGDSPLAYKDAFDLQIHGLTAGNTGTIRLYKNGELDSTSEYTFNNATPSIYRINASDFGKFLKAQIEVSGSFSSFIIQFLNLTYRVRPQHSMYLDTGYILPAEPGDLVWLHEAEIDMITGSDVTFKLFVEDEEFYSANIPAVSGVRKPYIVPLPRDAKGYRLRIILETTAANNVEDVGFDCYKVRVRSRSSGNKSGLEYNTVYPVGQAP